MTIARMSVPWVARAISLLACLSACSAGGRTASADTAAADTTPAAATRRDSAGSADSAKIADPNGPPDPARSSTAESDTATALLETECGGGVTGGGGSTFVTADGRFFHARHSAAMPNAARTLTFVRKDSSRAAALVQAAEDAGITRIAYVHPANMTCSLSLTRGGTTHEVAWPMGTTPNEIKKLVAVATQLSNAAR